MYRTRGQGAGARRAFICCTSACMPRRDHPGRSISHDTILPAHPMRSEGRRRVTGYPAAVNPKCRPGPSRVEGSLVVVFLHTRCRVVQRHLVDLIWRELTGDKAHPSELVVGALARSIGRHGLDEMVDLLTGE